MASEKSGQNFVFVGHAWHDRARAMELVEQLEAREIACWIAPRNVSPDGDFDEQIDQALRSCQTMLLLVSEDAEYSPPLRAETQRAHALGKPIIACRLADVPPAPWMAGIGGADPVADMFADDDMAELEKLVSSLKRPVKATPPPPPPSIETILSSAPTVQDNGWHERAVRPHSVEEPTPVIPDEELTRRFIGPNAAYYIRAWRKADQTGRVFGWNWVAWLFGPAWAATRRMHVWAIGSIVSLCGIIFLITNHWGQDGVGWVGGLLALFSILCGLFGNPLYRRRAEQVKALSAHESRQEQLDSAELAGGVSPIAAVAMSLLYAFALIMAIGLGIDAHKERLASVPDPVRDGEVAQENASWIGVGLQDIDEQIASAADLPDTKGAFIVEVAHTSPAAEAGLKVGDILIEVSGNAVANKQEAIEALAALTTGEAADVRIQRKGQGIIVPVTPIERPVEPGLTERFSVPKPTDVIAASKPLDVTKLDIGRWSAPSFYPSTRLWELGQSGLNASTYYLVPEKGKPVKLRGKAAEIHAYNKTSGLDISTKEKAADYLRFFNAFVWGADGAFDIVENPENLPSGVTEEMKSFIAPMEVQPDGDGYKATAKVRYGKQLFTAHFRIALSGNVDMLDDVPGPSGEALRSIKFINQQRQRINLSAAAVGYWNLWEAVPGPWTNSEEAEFLRTRELILAAER